jgi:hypothetical protein
MALQTDNQRAVDLLFRMKVAQHEVQRTQREISNTIRALDHLKTTNKDVTSASDRATQGLDRQARGMKRLTDETRKAREETQKASTAMAQMLAATGRSASAEDGGSRAQPFLGGRGSKLATFGTELRAMPAVMLPGMGFSSDVLAKMLNVVGRIDPAFLKVGAAGAAMTAVMLLAADSLNKAKEAALADLNARQKALELLKTGSREQIQERIKELEKEKALRQQAAQDALAIQQKLIADTDAALGSGITNLELLGGMLGLGQFGAVKQDLEEANKALGETSTELNLLQQGAAAAQFDIGELNKQLSQYRIEAAQDAFNKAKFQANAFNMTGKQLEQTLSDNAITMGALQVALKELAGDTSKEAIAQTHAYLKQLDDLRENQQYLIDIAGPYIDAKEAQAAADERAKKAAEEMKKQADEYAKAAESAAKAQSDYNAKLEDIASEVGKRIADAVRDRDKALAEAFADAERERAKVVEDVQEQLNENEQQALEDREEAQRDHQKRMLQIMRDFDRDSQTAIEDRDAVALERAEQARDDALAEEDDAHSERLRDIDKALVKENQQINKRYLEQLRAVDERLAEQTRRTVERYNEQMTAAIVYGNEQRRLAQQHLQQQLTDLRNALSGDLQLRNQAYKAMMQGAQVFSDWMLAQAAKLRVAASGGSTTGGGGRNTPTPFARGLDAGIAPAFRDIRVGENGPEILRLPRPGLVFTPQQYMGGGRSVSATFHIYGGNDSAIKIARTVEKYFDRFVKAI